MSTIVDSYSESNQDSANSYNSGSGSNTLGQSFTGDGTVLDIAKFYLKKQSSAIGTVSISIYAHTGAYGDGTPTGSALATSGTFDVSTLTTSYQLITFTFTGANKITLTNGTKYFAVFDLSISSASPNDFIVGMDRSSPSHAGNYAYFQSGSWTSGGTTGDICFYIYGDAIVSSPSLSPSLSFSSSPSISPSSSPSPSPLPPAGTVLKVAKSGVNVLTNSDPEKFIFSSEYGTLKYFAKETQQVQLVATGLGGDISAKGTYNHALGYYPYVEVYVRVYIGAPSGNYEYCPFAGAGATVQYSANYRITSSDIVLYGEINGVSTSTWNFDFIIFIYKNDLGI